MNQKVKHRTIPFSIWNHSSWLSLFDQKKDIEKFVALVVAQLVEQSSPMHEILGSNLNIGKILSAFSTLK